MKLVLLYGPPGVGKLTVARALQKLTNFKLLHNHLIADITSAVFDFGQPGRQELNHSIRRSVFQIAAKHNINGLISTAMYYAAGQQAERCNSFYQECVDLTNGTGGDKLCLVRLSCDQKTLETRVLDESRINTKKVTDVSKLKRIIAEDMPCAQVPEEIAKSLHIDNTNLEPERVASIIQRFYNL